jgi:bis(5'-nucleosyl)-tetraphosphatase (symmetrical)
VLDAPDGDELVEWLARRPLLHTEGDDLLVHAGLLPSWTVAEAARRARRVEARLRLAEPRRRLIDRAESEEGDDLKRVGGDLSILTSVRALTEKLELCSFAGPPAELPAGCRSWYAWPDRAAAGRRIFFGHWAALGLHLGGDAIGLDTGCSWGRELTAFRREDGAVRAQSLLDRV